jgi:hypothetical protein
VLSDVANGVVPIFFNSKQVFSVSLVYYYILFRKNEEAPGQRRACCTSPTEGNPREQSETEEPFDAVRIGQIAGFDLLLDVLLWSRRAADHALAREVDALLLPVREKFFAVPLRHVVIEEDDVGVAHQSKNVFVAEILPLRRPHVHSCYDAADVEPCFTQLLGGEPHEVGDIVYNENLHGAYSFCCVGIARSLQDRTLHLSTLLLKCQ